MRHCESQRNDNAYLSLMVEEAMMILMTRTDLDLRVCRLSRLFMAASSFRIEKCDWEATPGKSMLLHPSFGAVGLDWMSWA